MLSKTIPCEQAGRFRVEPGRVAVVEPSAGWMQVSAQNSYGKARHEQKHRDQDELETWQQSDGARHCQHEQRSTVSKHIIIQQIHDVTLEHMTWSFSTHRFGAGIYRRQRIGIARFGTTIPPNSSKWHWVMLTPVFWHWIFQRYYYIQQGNEETDHKKLNNTKVNNTKGKQLQNFTARASILRTMSWVSATGTTHQCNSWTCTSRMLCSSTAKCSKQILNILIWHWCCHKLHIIFLSFFLLYIIGHVPCQIWTVGQTFYSTGSHFG